MLGIEPGCPSAPLGVRDERIDQDLGREPGFNGWEDWLRSKVSITAMLVGVYCINPLTFEPGFKGSEDRPRFGERTRIQWMGGLAKIKSQYYRHVGRGLLHKPADI